MPEILPKGNLTWLMPCHFQWSIGHRPLDPIHLCLALPPAVPKWSRARNLDSSPDFLLEIIFLLAFLGHPLPLWPCGAQCSACLANVVITSSQSSQFYFLLKCLPRTCPSSWYQFLVRLACTLAAAALILWHFSSTEISNPISACSIISV